MKVGKVYQSLELDDTGGWFNNFIDFRDSLGGVLNLQVVRRRVQVLLWHVFCYLNYTNIP